jgi:hypothetical protein
MLELKGPQKAYKRLIMPPHGRPLSCLPRVRRFTPLRLPRKGRCAPRRASPARPSTCHHRARSGCSG